MIKIITDNKELSYDEDKNEVYLDGKLTEEYKPSFIPNGNDNPTFFGFLNMKTGVHYDIYGGKSTVSDFDDIKL